MKNYNHDLVQELSEKLDGIWRYDEYMKNAQEDGCEHCIKLWAELKEADEKLVEALRNEIKNHVKGDKFE